LSRQYAYSPVDPFVQEVGVAAAPSILVEFGHGQCLHLHVMPVIFLLISSILDGFGRL
jgi:hypothetical protein